MSAIAEKNTSQVSRWRSKNYVNRAARPAQPQYVIADEQQQRECDGDVEEPTMHARKTFSSCVRQQRRGNFRWALNLRGWRFVVHAASFVWECSRKVTETPSIFARGG